MQLSHANVVQVFDFGRTESSDFFLAMEFVEGVDVQRLRRSPGCERLPPAEALHIVAGTLRGLDYAHRRTDPDDRPLGIVHLDVKPANVLLSFEGEVKLTDFGVARSRDANRPAVGISGTIPYMSPEQARGDRVDPRSDVFSAGVLLYALLSGECPFGEEDTERRWSRCACATTSRPCRWSGSSASMRCCGARSTRNRTVAMRAQARSPMQSRNWRSPRAGAAARPRWASGCAAHSRRARAAERAVRAGGTPRRAAGRAPGERARR